MKTEKINLEGREIEFRNASGLEFKTLESELYREYHYPDGQVIRLNDPLRFHQSKSGGHRIFTAAEESVYIIPGWIRLTWKVRPGAPHFDF